MKNIFTFTLLLCSNILIYGQQYLNESFSTTTFPPTDWTIQSVDTGNNTWYKINGINSANLFENKTTEQNERLITPTIDLSGTNVAFLAFDIRLLKIPQIDNNTADLFVKISTNNGLNWIDLWDETQFNFGSSNDVRQIVSVDLSSYTGIGMNEIKIMFQYTSTIHNLDDLGIIQLYNVNVASCVRPIITSQNTEITWTNPPGFSGTIEIEYGPINFTQGSGTLVTGLTGNSYTIPTMDCNSYDYFIRANCGGTTSLWSNRNSRRQTSNLSGYQLTSTSFSPTWLGFGNDFILEYGPQGFTSGTGATVNNINSTTVINGSTFFTYNINGLSPCTTYTVRVKSSCSTSDAWTEFVFSTLSDNVSPLTILPITETFTNGNSVCSLGYVQGNSNVATITNNELRVSYLSGMNTSNNWLHSRKMSLVSGQDYTIQIDARRITTGINSANIGVIRLRREGDSNFSQDLLNFSSSNTTDSFTNFNTTINPSVTDNYYLEFRTNTFNFTMAYDNLTVSETLSTYDNELLKTSVYPNPTKNYININDSPLKNIKENKVLDINGKVILKTNQKQINLDFLPNGVYLLKIETETGETEIHKIVKK